MGLRHRTVRAGLAFICEGSSDSVGATDEFQLRITKEEWKEVAYSSQPSAECLVPASTDATQERRIDDQFPHRGKSGGTIRGQSPLFAPFGMLLPRFAGRRT